MKKILLLLFALSFLLVADTQRDNAPSIISYRVSAKNITFFSKDPQGVFFQNLLNLKTALHTQGKELLFAMNGGMYLDDLTPQGLYIENGIEFKKIDLTQEAFGNFYMQPNGIFSITKKGKPAVTTSKDFIQSEDIYYATQSGPMLVIDGKLHPKFIPNSKNIHIRNGVGILPNGELLFAISKEKINFYDFASFFKEKGCKNALYLDGFVSRVYLPKEGVMEYDSVFGIIIAQVEDVKNR